MLHPDLDSLKTILYRAIQEVAWCKVSIVEEDIKMLSASGKCRTPTTGRSSVTSAVSSSPSLHSDSAWMYMGKVREMSLMQRRLTTPEPEHTSRLCAVPWLRPVLEPTPLPIVCRPLLSEQQMEQYNRYIERRYCTVLC